MRLQFRLNILWSYDLKCSGMGGYLSIDYFTVYFPGQRAVLISFVRKLELRNICGDNYEAFAIVEICFNSLFAIASCRKF